VRSWPSHAPCPDRACLISQSCRRWLKRGITSTAPSVLGPTNSYRFKRGQQVLQCVRWMASVTQRCHHISLSDARTGALPISSSLLWLRHSLGKDQPHFNQWHRSHAQGSGKQEPGRHCTLRRPQCNPTKADQQPSHNCQEKCGQVHRCSSQQAEPSEQHGGCKTDRHKCQVTKARRYQHNARQTHQRVIDRQLENQRDCSHPQDWSNDGRWRGQGRDKNSSRADCARASIDRGLLMLGYVRLQTPAFLQGTASLKFNLERLAWQLPSGRGE